MLRHPAGFVVELKGQAEAPVEWPSPLAPAPPLYSGRYVEADHPSNGPAVTFTRLLPRQHHYRGWGGGRAFPFWYDNAAPA